MIDYKFELQMTISIFVMVFGAITAGFKAYLAAYAVFFSFGIIQLVLLTTIRNYTRLPFDQFSTLKYGQDALDVSTMLFSVASVFVISEQILFVLSNAVWERLLFPLVISAFTSIPIWRGMLNSRYWRKLRFELTPHEFEIYNEYSEDSITLFIQNKTNSLTEIKLAISIPLNVKMRIDGHEELNGRYEQKINLHTNEEVVQELYFRLDGRAREISVLRVEVSTKKGSVSQSANLIGPRVTPAVVKANQS